MGYQLNPLSASYPAGNFDFSATTGPIFVKFDSTSRVVPATVNSKIEGVITNVPPIGNVCSVAYVGVVKLKVDNAYVSGILLTSDSQGLGTACTGDSTLGRAIVIEASDATNNIIAVRLTDSNMISNA